MWLHRIWATPQSPWHPQVRSGVCLIRTHFKPIPDSRTLIPHNMLRMRLVLSSSTNAVVVSSCGLTQAVQATRALICRDQVGEREQMRLKPQAHRLYSRKQLVRLVRLVGFGAVFHMRAASMCTASVQCRYCLSDDSKCPSTRMPPPMIPTSKF